MTDSAIELGLTAGGAVVGFFLGGTGLAALIYAAVPPAPQTARYRLTLAALGVASGALGLALSLAVAP